MDSNRFDYLTKSFALFNSRRGLLKLAAAGLVAIGAGTALSEDGEAARCVKPGRRCRRRNGTTKKCCRGARCAGDTCVCKGNKTRCRRKCVNLNNDEKNCGSCGNTCPSGSSCKGGTCENGDTNCPTECCTNDDCQGTEICSQSGTCICPNECCADSDCPQPSGVCQSNGTCNCGQCCFNTDCAPNQNCVLVNDTRFCFCKPELVCGNGQICCPANLSCNQSTQTCV